MLKRVMAVGIAPALILILIATWLVSFWGMGLSLGEHGDVLLTRGRVCIDRRAHALRQDQFTRLQDLAKRVENGKRRIAEASADSQMDPFLLAGWKKMHEAARGDLLAGVQKFELNSQDWTWHKHGWKYKTNWQPELRFAPFQLAIPVWLPLTMVLFVLAFKRITILTKVATRSSPKHEQESNGVGADRRLFPTAALFGMCLLGWAVWIAWPANETSLEQSDSLIDLADPSTHYPFRDTSLPIATRVNDLIERLTVEEKLQQMMALSPAIPRLGIPAYSWRNEGLHGLMAPQVNKTTVFPQSIGLAACFDENLVRDIGKAIADQARFLQVYHSNRDQWFLKYTGLNLWAPNINILRDPRWGRGQETYGEDPYLTSQLAMAYVSGLQGNDPKSIKTIATPKHFAVHSGPEKDRFGFDVAVSPRDLADTFLPAFQKALGQSQAGAVMCAYNSLDGCPCCANSWLLNETLRERWGFDGFVVADCGAVANIHDHHLTASSATQAAARAVNAGTDIICDGDWTALARALSASLLDEATVDRSLRRSVSARFELGLFDPPKKGVLRTKAEGELLKHGSELALKAALRSIVLLENNGILPLAKTTSRIAVIGPNADEVSALLGNYHGNPVEVVTPLEGIRTAVSQETLVTHSHGCNLVAGDALFPEIPLADAGQFQEAVRAAERADVAILCMGLSPFLEGEEDPTIKAPGFLGGDRLDLALPLVQRQLLEAVAITGTPIVLVLLNGGPLSVGEIRRHCAAIVEAWYPGEQGGTALAQVLFGDHNPGGRLPVTIYESVRDLPAFDDYSMSNRTYRYFAGEPLYPFGYGLSYTLFEYRDLMLEQSQIPCGKSVRVNVTVQNVGNLKGQEVVQVYLRDQEASGRVPIRSLQGFARIELEPGRQQIVSFDIEASQMSFVNEDGRRVIEPGWFELAVGGHQPAAQVSTSSSTVLLARFQVVGSCDDLPLHQID